jgi:hypothetical protein
MSCHESPRASNQVRTSVYRGGCPVLSPLSIPGSVEYIGKNCFGQCYAVKTLTFAAPSRLRVSLDVPWRWRGFLTMPDSVKRLCVSNLRGGSESILDFDVDSRLKSIEWLQMRKGANCFLHLSSLSLKLS